MIRKMIIASSVISMLLLIGCGEPSFNPHNKGIVFYKGFPFYVPRGAYYGDETQAYKFNMSKKNLSTVKDPLSKKQYQKLISRQCKRNELLWLSLDLKKQVQEKEHKVRKLPSSQQHKGIMEIFDLIHQGKITGKAGCVKSLGKQEYEYLLNQQNQKAANARMRSQSNDIADISNSLTRLNNNMTARQPTIVNVKVNHSYKNDHTYQVNTGL